ncbi:MAG: cytochrome P460 family protein [Candidatus Eisenbacteria bacterium]|uniref:Cytochrome P460 family protein n=1 Tax=Eiseniibacteriota bacterium TaxID=2212470 RepID=A0A849SL02_UNCEI|nr:cytochrome P460 family protein [Candidatus Eisenbacteria bacterium]
MGLSILTATVAGSPLLSSAANESHRPVSYPQGYRSWNHMKTLAIVAESHPLFDSFGGIHHVYVNRTGMAAAHTGKPYPDGSVIVFDLLAADSKDGAVSEGSRKFIGVMRKDRKAYAATGGWGFEGFKGDSPTDRMVTDAAKQCFGCHQSRATNDFVFSEYRP